MSVTRLDSADTDAIRPVPSPPRLGDSFTTEAVARLLAGIAIAAALVLVCSGRDAVGVWQPFVWIDLAVPGNSAGFDLAFYENGPWGNIEWRLEAWHNNQVVATDNEVISNLGGRDNATFKHLSVAAPQFESLHLYGWLNGNYTVPRGMIDNLSITSVPEPASAGLSPSCRASQSGTSTAIVKGNIAMAKA